MGLPAYRATVAPQLAHLILLLLLAVCRRVVLVHVGRAAPPTEVAACAAGRLDHVSAEALLELAHALAKRVHLLEQLHRRRLRLHR